MLRFDGCLTMGHSMLRLCIWSPAREERQSVLGLGPFSTPLVYQQYLSPPPHRWIPSNRRLHLRREAMKRSRPRPQRRQHGSASHVVWVSTVGRAFVECGHPGRTHETHMPHAHRLPHACTACDGLKLAATGQRRPLVTYPLAPSFTGATLQLTAKRYALHVHSALVVAHGLPPHNARWQHRLPPFSPPPLP
jgi:hypothetical protein